MTTLSDRPNTALLIVDVQNGVMADAVRRETVMANLVTLVGKARAHQTPVVWVQHSSDELAPGSEPWRYVPELEQAEGEPVVHKRYGDSFEETDLEAVLAERSVGRLVVAGAQTDACVMSTLHGALVRGYDTLLVEDAHTTEDLTEWGGADPEKVIDHLNLHWKYHRAPGREAGTVATAEVVFD